MYTWNVKNSNCADSRQYGLAIFKDLDRINPSYSTAGYPHEVNHQSDTASTYAEQIEPIEMGADLAPSGYSIFKHKCSDLSKNRSQKHPFEDFHSCHKLFNSRRSPPYQKSFSTLSINTQTTIDRRLWPATGREASRADGEQPAHQRKSNEYVTGSHKRIWIEFALPFPSKAAWWEAVYTWRAEGRKIFWAAKA